MAKKTRETRMWLDLRVCDAAQDIEVMDQYHDLFRKAFQAAPWRFHRTTKTDMMQDGARVAYIRDLNTGEILSAARGTITPENTLLITQACTAPFYKGRGFIGYVVDELRLSFFADPPTGVPQITDAELYVRILEGDPNRSVARAYEKVDFETREVRRFEIEGGFRDRHLYQSCDQDGKYSCLWMTADGASLKNCLLRTNKFRAEYGQ